MNLFDRWRAYRKWQKALKGPDAFDAIAAGPDEWAEINARKENAIPQSIEEYSVKLFTLATEGANAIRKLSEDRTIEQPRYGLDREWFPVFTAFHSLYLYLTDREAFARVGDAGRYKIMNPLVYHSIDVAVETVLVGMPRDKLPGIKKECVEHLNWSNETYAQYKRLLPAPGESAEGTALWRFGVEVAELAGRPGHTVYILKSQEHALTGVSTLDAKSYVARFVTTGTRT